MKAFKIDFSFQRALTKEYAILLVLFVSAMTLLVFIVIRSQLLLEKRDEFFFLRDEVERIETRINLVDSYKLLSEEEINQNNRVLEDLIPSGDTNLSMYYILDDLSVKTGLSLSNYRLASTNRSAEASSVSINAAGTAEELTDFLSKHRFITGRLLTLQSIQISKESRESDILNIQMVLNYYTTEIRSISNVQRTVSQKDIEFLREVREQVEQFSL